MPQLRRLNPLSMARLRPTLGLGWLLEQYEGPVATISRAAYGWSLETTAEQWYAAVRRRRRRLGWHLEFWRPDEPEASLYYQPRTVLAGGRLTLVDGGSYKLSLVRGHWRLVDGAGAEVCRIAFRDRHYRTKELGAHFTFGEHAVDEPNLPVLVFAASVACIIHDIQARSPGVSSI